MKHWATNQESPDFLVGAATLLSNWAATRPRPQVQAPAGPSKGKNTHLQPPTTHQEPPLRSSPPPSPSNTTIVIKKDWAKEKSRRQADAAASKPKATKPAKGACVRCITQKHKCDYSRARGGGKKNTKGKQCSEASSNDHSK